MRTAASPGTLQTALVFVEEARLMYIQIEAFDLMFFLT
jgi:hypothetical protein